MACLSTVSTNTQGAKNDTIMVAMGVFDNVGACAQFKVDSLVTAEAGRQMSQVCTFDKSYASIHRCFIHHCSNKDENAEKAFDGEIKISYTHVTALSCQL